MIFDRHFDASDGFYTDELPVSKVRTIVSRAGAYALKNQAADPVIQEYDAANFESLFGTVHTLADIDEVTGALETEQESRISLGLLSAGINESRVAYETELPSDGSFDGFFPEYVSAQRTMIFLNAAFQVAKQLSR